MFQPQTFQELCNAMQMGATVNVDGTIGTINGIQREDGSGRCWIINMRPNGRPENVDVFIRAF